jgi:dTMP kinase
MSTHVTKGILIIIEGIDGAGKSTQARMLFDELQRLGIDVILSREPTDSKYGRKIRELAEKGRETVRPEEEYRLFMKDRKIHVDTLILPALTDGKVVILDRYYFSTIAYQGALGLDPAKIRQENEAFCPIPDIVLMVDIPTAIGIDRIKKYRKETPNLFEKASYLEKVAENLAALSDDFIVRIDGSGHLEDVQRRIRAQVEPLLKKIARSPSKTSMQTT